MNKIRLLVIEDNRLLRECLTVMLNDQPDIEVVAAFGNGKDALKAIKELKPEIVLLDLGLKGQNSLRLVELVKKESSEIKVIVMDLIPVQADIADFVKEGVSGFILKDGTFDDFLKNIRSVAAGVNVLPPSLTGSLFSQIVEQVVGEGRVKLIKSVRMAKREREVIELIAEGLSNKEIAQRLNIATYTVKSHVAQHPGKTGIAHPPAGSQLCPQSRNFKAQSEYCPSDGQRVIDPKELIPFSSRRVVPF